MSKCWASVGVTRPETLPAILSFGKAHCVRGLITLSLVDINARDEHGHSALHLAAGVGLTGRCQNLITHGADVNAVDKLVCHR